MTADLDALLKEAASRPCLYCNANFWGRIEHRSDCLVARLAEALRERVLPKKLHLRLICCGHDWSKPYHSDDWEVLNRQRLSYIEHVDSGHSRTGIIEECTCM